MQIKTFSSQQNNQASIKAFYDLIDKNILINDDKDTFEDFMHIFTSSDARCQLSLKVITIEDELISGIQYCQLKIDKQAYIFIIYIVTDKDHRRHGYGARLVQLIHSENPDAIILAEILDGSMIDSSKLKLESIYSGITTTNRDAFWLNLGFEPWPYHYANPIPDLSQACNGVIHYNKLIIHNQTGEKIALESLLQGIKLYFTYGYCAGNTQDHQWAAYNEILEQFKD